MTSISSSDIISVFVPETKMFLCIPASAADAAAANPNRIKTLLANGLITFFKVTLFLILDQEVYEAMLLIVLS